MSTNIVQNGSVAIDADDVQKAPPTTFLGRLTEDWWAVIIGGFIVVMILLVAFANPSFKFTTPVYQWQNSDDLLNKVLAIGNLAVIGTIGIAFLVLASAAIALSGGSIRNFVRGFGLIFLLGLTALIIAGNKTVAYYGIEYVVFGLISGLIISNVFSPGWLKEAARSEFFIKTGLVILGTSVLFTDIIKAGVPGILQAVVVVAVVWFFSLWLSRKLKVDDEFGVILASAVSICGVSAAIVAAGAIKGDKRKLSYVTSLVLLVAIPMLIIQPWLAGKLNLPELVAGAWLGGTLDTTASVTAAAALVGPLALKAGVIVKFSQNVLIGVAAIFIAAWWTLKKNPNQANATEGRGAAVIWDRFPKFVLGFIAASLIFSFLIPAETTKQVSGILNSLRTLWFALAFVAIGMEARFADLVRIQGGRPAIAFIAAQLFNILWTLLWSYLLFGGILFPAPDMR
ncbi:putative sulfate exporter family transporter [Segetibacter sp. 3557_3]|uniref:YeiH family protein n=1 Tax=Segetibacter sp. 3557_3 TaxID=2547429 RepID=UPI0010589226|nr:putative sulfate exporter family transporter [Segetibacter sp. 3557_3]TDH24536.1 putative sulfate exporter family transporter [Segetibacter sp. 3557_3]